MKKYYGKKRFVPRKCSVCNKKCIKGKNLGEVIQNFWFGYKIGMDRRQPGFKGIDRWFGDCSKCDFLEAIEMPSLMTTEFQGSVLTCPVLR